MNKEINGKKKQSSAGSKAAAGTIDGKQGLKPGQNNSKLTVKYTFERSKEDINKIEELRKHLQFENHTCRFNTDSEIYRELPDIYMNTVKRLQQELLQNEELTAKLEQLQILQQSICHIIEMCKGE